MDRKCALCNRELILDDNGGMKAVEFTATHIDTFGKGLKGSKYENLFFQMGVNESRSRIEPLAYKAKKAKKDIYVCDDCIKEEDFKITKFESNRSTSMSYGFETMVKKCVLCGDVCNSNNIIRNDFYGSSRLVFTDPDTNIQYFGQCNDVKFYCDELEHKDELSETDYDGPYEIIEQPICNNCVNKIKDHFTTWNYINPSNMYDFTFSNNEDLVGQNNRVAAIEGYHLAIRLKDYTYKQLEDIFTRHYDLNKRYTITIYENEVHPLGNRDIIYILDKTINKTVYKFEVLDVDDKVLLIHWNCNSFIMMDYGDYCQWFSFAAH